MNTKGSKNTVWGMILAVGLAMVGAAFILEDVRVMAAVAIGWGLVSYGVGRYWRERGWDSETASALSVSMKENDEDRFLHEIVKELSHMQSSQDLLERYQGFERMVEASLFRALGPCTVTYWCPDNRWRELVECVIRPTGGAETAVGRGGMIQGRSPCRVPLDSRIIEHVLRSQRPYLKYDPGSSRLMVSYAPEGSLPSEACISLERLYGQPLVVNVNKICEPLRVRPDDFYLAVDLITLFWEQLQATNQRQWMVEHEEASRALRDDAFLRQAQQRAEQAQQADERFSLIVLAIHGFRGMFAGQAHRWRELHGVIGREVYHAISEHKAEVLLGKMADDIFVVQLPHTDEFLADALMRKVIGSLQRRLPQDLVLRRLDIMAIEARWALADQKKYAGSVSDMLNGLYRRMFRREGASLDRMCHIELGSSLAGVS